MVKFGNISLTHGLMLAPMAGVTDLSFRQLCRRYGAEYAVTEMVSAKATVYEDKKTAVLAETDRDDGPVSIQIFGSDPEIMAKAAAMLCGAQPSNAAIDINMGCPVNKIVSNGEGSALMKDPKRCGEIVAAVKKAVRVPVTVKMRIGWDGQSLNAVEVARRVEDVGADAICVHGRTRVQMYQPPVDLSEIAKVKKAVSIPVIGNGGINTAEDARRMLDETGCDGLMIARGACGNPFLFAELRAMLEGKSYTPPTVEERLNVAVEHFDAMLSDKGHMGMLEARKHLGWYLHGIPGAAAARDRINRSEDVDEIRALILSLI